VAKVFLDALLWAHTGKFMACINRLRAQQKHDFPISPKRFAREKYLMEEKESEGMNFNRFTLSGAEIPTFNF